MLQLEVAQVGMGNINSQRGPVQNLCSRGSRLLQLNLSREEEEEVSRLLSLAEHERQRDSQERGQQWQGTQLAGGGI